MAIPTPSYETTEDRHYETVQSPIGAGAFHRRPFHRPTSNQPPVGFVLRYEPGQLNESRAQDLIDAWTAGGTTTYQPGWAASAYTVTFEDDVLELDVASVVAFGATVRLRTVIS